MVTGFPSPGSGADWTESVPGELRLGPSEATGLESNGERSGLSPRRAADWLRRAGGTWAVGRETENSGHGALAARTGLSLRIPGGLRGISLALVNEALRPSLRQAVSTGEN